MKHEAIAGFYNNIEEKFGNDYEEKRWFRSPVTISHFKMATKAISRSLRGVSYERCFELGPGAGTWTKLLLTHEPKASYTLLDISETMLNMAKEALEGCRSVSFIVHDFLTYQPTDTYDLFFSSRALEYILDKEAAVKKMYTLLRPQGHAVVITKNPRYFAYTLLGRTIPEMHRNQITPHALAQLMRDAGFEVHAIRPATVTVPFCKSAFLNDIAFFFLKSTWSPLHRILAESYIIHAERHGD
jgi:ubiquinone/menaquinone biosynthesis C-methylase UbiE